MDFAEYGVPGLSYRIAYVRGDNIDAGAAKRGKVSLTATIEPPMIGI